MKNSMNISQSFSMNPSHFNGISINVQPQDAIGSDRLLCS